MIRSSWDSIKHNLPWCFQSILRRHLINFLWDVILISIIRYTCVSFDWEWSQYLLMLRHVFMNVFLYYFKHYMRNLINILKWNFLIMSLTLKFLNLLLRQKYLIIDVSISAESVMVINIDKYRQIYLKLHDWLSYI